MEKLSKETVRQLTSAQDGTCISIFMPLYSAPPESKQNHIRFKNLLSEVKHQCRDWCSSGTNIEALLDPLDDLLQDPFFWEAGDRGLALFRSRKLYRIFHLPRPIRESCMVNDRFHIKPLLPFLEEDMLFFLLALDLNDAKLYRCDRFDIEEIPLENTPCSLDEALKYDDPEQQLQFHTGTPSSPTKRAAIFHGQGIGVDEARHKEDIGRFFSRLQKGIHDALRKEEAPLLLAGVEYLHPLYTETNQYHNVMTKGILGSPSRMTEQELHRKGLELVKSIYDEHREQALKRYSDLSRTERATEDVEQVVRAAFFGQVDTLLAAHDKHIRGDFDSSTGLVTSSAYSRNDLIDLAATQTLLHGGEIFMLGSDEMPASSPLAALLRY